MQKKRKGRYGSQLNLNIYLIFLNFVKFICFKKVKQGTEILCSLYLTSLNQSDARSTWTPPKTAITKTYLFVTETKLG